MSGSASPWLSGSETGPLVSDFVNEALLVLGVGAQGTTASGVDIASGVRHLNLMFGQWQRRRWMITNLVDCSALSNGAQEYLVGPETALPGEPTSSTFLTAGSRPDKLDAVYARYLGNGRSATDVPQWDPLQLDPTQLATYANSDSIVGPGAGLALDYPLALIPSWEDYTNIGLKNLTTWPTAAYYRPDYPAGKLFVWPIPALGLWEIHISFKAPLQVNLEATSPLNLPPEYWDAVMWCLAVRLAPSYGQQAPPIVTAMAQAALATIRAANNQTPLLSYPVELTRMRGSLPVGYFLGGLF